MVTQSSPWGNDISIKEAGSVSYTEEIKEGVKEKMEPTKNKQKSEMK